MSDQQHILTVSEITQRIKGVLERGFNEVWVQGEISNLKLHSSGHVYFTLKDQGAQLSAVLWRGRASQLLFRPVDGMKIIVRGNITVYEPRGSYQIDCLQIQPIGVGELQLAFERLKKKLNEEGLFDPSHKKTIPQFPHRIGVVTSPTGAAIHDILSVLRRRFPALDVIFAPVKVQGIGAAEEIAEAIGDLNKLGDVDVMIVGRGGGSLEDLWAFNEEIVARAIYGSHTPIVSAVGHEIDFSISDFVADLRAPTPSAAAELVVRDKQEVIELLYKNLYTVQQFMQGKVEDGQRTVRHLIGSYAFNKPVELLRRQSQIVDEFERRLTQRTKFKLSMIHQSLQGLSKRIESLNPQSVLKRGYAIVRRDSHTVSSVSSLFPLDEISIQLHDGALTSIVQSTTKE
jgi:exodeoxyribonuclease VII large subunit